MGAIKMISVALNDHTTETPITKLSHTIRRACIVAKLSESYAYSCTIKTDYVKGYEQEEILRRADTSHYDPRTPNRVISIAANTPRCR